MRVRTFTPAAAEPISLGDAKLHLRIDHADEDALVTALIIAAREWCENRIGRTLITSTLRLTLDAWPDDNGGVELPRGPVQSVAQVRYRDEAGAQQMLGSTFWSLDNAGDDAPHYLLPAYGTQWPTVRDQANAVEIDYVAGYGTAGSSVPAAVRQWILLAVGEMYTHREATVVGTIATRLAFADRLLDGYTVPRF